MQMCDWLIQPGKLHWKKRAFTREGHLQVSTPHAHEGCLVEDWVSSSELTYEICQVSVSLKKKNHVVAMKHKQDGKSGALTMSRVFNADSLKMSINELDTF